MPDAKKIDLRGMFTPIRNCVSVQTGSVSLSKLRELEARNYDESPVFDPSGEAIGVVPTIFLRDKYDRSEELLVSDPKIRLEKVEVLIELDEFLSRLQRVRSVFVATGSGEVLGLVTMSDLNSHVFRAAIYPLLARLESRLAHVIDEEFPDPWTWLKWLGDGASGVVGHWEILKRNGMDLGASCGATLVQLLQVAERHDLLRGQLGFESKTKCGDFRGRVASVRNAVMHPARPLIESQDGIARLRSVLRGVQFATQGLGAEIREHAKGMP